MDSILSVKGLLIQINDRILMQNSSFNISAGEAVLIRPKRMREKFIIEKHPTIGNRRKKN